MLKPVMISKFYHGCATFSSTSVTRMSVDSSSLTRMKDSISKYLRFRDHRPPYTHVCQIGDPVLRQPAKLVDPAKIQTFEIQKIINAMKVTMDRYDLIALAAPQIGESVQIFMLEITEETAVETASQLSKFHEGTDIYEADIVPFRIFINPKLEILDSRTMTSLEGCASIVGFTADVKRFRKVQVTGLNEFGKQVTWIAQDFAACVAQHEFDHLQGLLYTDKMNVHSFSYTCWRRVNNCGGMVKVTFYPTFIGTKRFLQKILKKYFVKKTVS